MRKWYAKLTEEQKTSLTVLVIGIVIMTAVGIYICNLPFIKAENAKNKKTYIDNNHDRY